MGYRKQDEKPVSTVTYQDIVIGYYESDNQWTFELRGRERTVESLAKAKEAIDKPAPEKKEAFKPIAAFNYENNHYMGIGGAKFVAVTITSLVEAGHYAWINSSEKGYRSNGRSKERADNLYLATSENAEKVVAWAALQKQVVELTEKMEVLKKSMKTAAQLAKELAE
jgi:hypothetical protein